MSFLRRFCVKPYIIGSSMVGVTSMTQYYYKQRQTDSSLNDDTIYNNNNNNSNYFEYFMNSFIYKNINNIDDYIKISIKRNQNNIIKDKTLINEWQNIYNNCEIMFSKDSNSDISPKMEKICRTTQLQLCELIENIEGTTKFSDDLYYKGSKDAGGITKVLQNGKIFEKAGVSIKVSKGKLLKSKLIKMSKKHKKLRQFLDEDKIEFDDDNSVTYSWTSISSILHCHNPHIPTAHFHYRYFEFYKKDTNGKYVPHLWWFGGGGELFPSILYEDDCKYFHGIYKNICDKYDKKLYGKLKEYCDDYFVLKHNNERLGIGGIAFDDLYELNGNCNDRDNLLNFLKELASHWTTMYIPIVKKHCNKNYNNKHKEWQLLNRGKWVYFILQYSYGTKFGLLNPNARHESILMSLPIHASFNFREPIYDFESKVHNVQLLPKNWV